MHFTFNRSILCFLATLILLFSSMACAPKGLVTEKYPEKSYSVPRLMPNTIEKNPTFLVYGDSRPGWQIEDEFLNKKIWLSWRAILFPYWLVRGIIGGINWLRHVPDYGGRERLMVRDAIYEEAKRSKIDFILHTGDMVNDGQRPKHWISFLKENKIKHPLLEEYPYLPTIGNHDKVNDSFHGFHNYQAIFSYPHFYVIDFPDCALFIVNSGLIFNKQQMVEEDKQEKLFQRWFISGEESDNPSWMEKELGSRNNTFKIIVMHHPPLSFGKHHQDWENTLHGKNLQIKRQQLLKLFQEQGVKIVISGHEHLYEHTILRYKSESSKPDKELHVIVSGGGGAPLQEKSNEMRLEKYKKNYLSQGLDTVLIKQEDIYHYCLFQIKQEGVSIKVFQVTGDVAKPVTLIENILVSK